MSMHIHKGTRMTEMTKKIAMTGLLALVAVGVTLPLAAQQKASEAKAVAAKAVAQAGDEEETATASKPGGDGIKVHGHWIIDVRDKDGKLVEHRDFQNALQAAGGGILGALLTGQAVPDQLYVVVGGGSVSAYQISGSTSLAAATCSATGGGHCATGLTQTLVAGGLTLSGQFTAAVADSLTFVGTNLMSCVTRDSSTSFLLPTTTAPASCKAGYQSGTAGSGSTPYNTTYSSPFTSKDLSAAPLAVSAGQTVQVSVTITFS